MPRIEIDQDLLRWVDEEATRSGRSRDEVLDEDLTSVELGELDILTPRQVLDRLR